MSEQLPNLLGKAFLPGDGEAGAPYLSPDLFDAALIRRSAVALGLCEPSISDVDLVLLYLDTPDLCMLSPCRLFVEAWYRDRYADVQAAIVSGLFPSGYTHFINAGLQEGRWPSPRMERRSVGVLPADEVSEVSEDYLERDLDAREFISVFNWVRPTDYYNIYGRYLNAPPPTLSEELPAELTTLHGAVFAEFDEAFYVATYLGGRQTENPFAHYIRFGVKNRFSPNAWFQEDWYRAFYWDVNEVIESGGLPSGFYHYLNGGRAEGRMAAYDRARMLDLSRPDHTGLTPGQRLDFLDKHLRAPKELALSPLAYNAPRTIWLVLPTLNAELSVGGYAASFALMVALGRLGFTPGFICTQEDRPNRDYFLWRVADSAVREIVSRGHVVGRQDIASTEFGDQDQIIVHSVWDLVLGNVLAFRLTSRLPFLMVQDYEPAFCENGTMQKLCAEQYDVPHRPLFKTLALQQYFQNHGLGAMRADRQMRSSFHSFEPPLKFWPVQTADMLRDRPERTLVLHTEAAPYDANTLFEMSVMALQSLCAEGVFGPEWTFIAIGTAGTLPDFPLGRDHILRFVPHPGANNTARLMEKLDIGVSLMDAPGAAVTALEFAMTGALVLTNIHETRGRDALLAMSNNFVPCDATLSGIKSALREALSGVNDFTARAEQALQRPHAAAWEAIFTSEFLMPIFEPSSDSASSREDPEVNESSTVSGQLDH